MAALKVVREREMLFKNIKQVIEKKDQIKEELKEQPEVAGATELLLSRSKTIAEVDEAENNYVDDQVELVELLLRPHKLLLTFSQSQKVAAQEFYEYLYQQDKLFLFLCNICLLVVYLIDSVIFIIIRDQIEENVTIIALRFTFVSVLLGLLLFAKILRQNWWMTYGMIIFLSFGVTVSAVHANHMDESALWSTFQRIQQLEIALIYLVGSNCSGLSFVASLFFTLITTAIWLALYWLSDGLDLGTCYFFFVFIVFGLVQVWVNRKSAIMRFNSLQVREFKTHEQQQLVSQLLPAHAEKKFFDNPTNKEDLLDSIEDVTILFADIAGFTSYSASHTAEEVVVMLSKLFTEFDKACVKHNLYKVCTIGDCYVAMSYVEAKHRDKSKEAHNMVEFGFDTIRAIIETRKAINFNQFTMRIGIHTGRLFGGIIGTDIVRYDIFGPDVTIANKMESSGLKEHIHISETTKLLLEETYSQVYKFEPYKPEEEVTYPDGRPMPSYLVYRRADDQEDS